MGQVFFSNSLEIFSYPEVMYIILTDSKCFLGSLWPYLFGVKSVNARGVCTKKAYVWNAYIENIISCAGNTYTRNIFIIGAYIGLFITGILMLRVLKLEVFMLVVLASRMLLPSSA